MELINNVAKAHGGYTVLQESVRELESGNDLYHEMIDSGVIDLETGKFKVALVYGQMNEPPGSKGKLR